MKDLDSEKFGSGWVVCWSQCLLARANCMHPFPAPCSVTLPQWLGIGFGGSIENGKLASVINQVSTPSLLNRYPHPTAPDVIQGPGPALFEACTYKPWSARHCFDSYSAFGNSFSPLGPQGFCECLTEDFASVREVGHWKQRLGMVVSLATRSGSGTGEAFFRDTLLPL